MDWDDIKSTVQWFYPILGGAVVWLYTQWEKSKKARIEAQKTIAEREQTYSQIVEGRNKALLEENEVLRKKIFDLHMASISKSNLSVTEIIKEIVNSDPGISWVKVRISEGIYKFVRVSPGYARIYLKENPEYYDNKTSSDIYGQDIGSRATKSDESVYRNQQGIFVNETITHTPSGVKGHFIGRKYSVYVDGDANYIFGSGYHVNPDGSIDYGMIPSKSTE